MPATFILLPAVVIGVIVWIVAWWYTRRLANRNQRDEIKRLRNRAAWLEQRLDRARQERWDRAMILGLSDQLGTACQDLADVRHGRRRSLSAQHHGPSSR
jgi:hypothetical protein